MVEEDVMVEEGDMGGEGDIGGEAEKVLIIVFNETFRHSVFRDICMKI